MEEITSHVNDPKKALKRNIRAYIELKTKTLFLKLRIHSKQYLNIDKMFYACRTKNILYDLIGDREL